MKRKVQAKVSWVSKQAGGRHSPPPGPRYITVARFDEDRESYPEEAWSLVLELSSPPSNSLDLIVDVSFLADDAPDHLLHPGSRFELFEGRQRVATGEVL